MRLAACGAGRLPAAAPGTRKRPGELVPPAPPRKPVACRVRRRWRGRKAG